MNGPVWLILLAVVLRSCGSIARVYPKRLFLHTIGWVLCTSAVWLMVSAMGAWPPIAAALLFGLLGALVETQSLRYRHELWLATDLGVVLLSGLLSIPTMEALPLLAATILALATGLITDWLLIHYLKLQQLITMMLPFGILMYWPLSTVI